jgi:hemoglobin
MFHGLVEGFYARVLGDARLARHFAGLDLDRIKAHQRAFLIQALGGAGSYSGRELRTAHETTPITREAFFAATDHLVNALYAAGIEESLIGEVIDRIEPLSQSIVNR